MAGIVWNVVYPKVFGRSHHLLLNKFFDQSIPSMRNVDDGEENKTRLGLQCQTPLSSYTFALRPYPLSHIP